MLGMMCVYYVYCSQSMAVSMVSLNEVIQRGSQYRNRHSIRVPLGNLCLRPLRLQDDQVFRILATDFK